MIEVFWGWK